MEGVQLMIEEEGLMISAVPDGDGSKASTRVEREVGEQASGHASRRARRQASQNRLQNVHDVQQIGK